MKENILVRGKLSSQAFLEKEGLKRIVKDAKGNELLEVIDVPEEQAQIERKILIFLVSGPISWHNISKDFLAERSIMK